MDKKNIIGCMLMVLTLVACTKESNQVAEENEPQVKTITFTASSEEGVATRTTLASDNSVYWTSGDAISVLDVNTTSSNTQCVLISGINSTKGKFEGVSVPSTETGYYAIYPFSSQVSMSTTGNISGLNLPPEQNATEGSFDKNAAILTAYTSTDVIAFRNLCAYIEFTPEFDCKEVTFTTAGNEYLSGSFNASIGSDGIFSSIINEADVSKTVKLTGVISANKTYVLTVLPNTLNSGFSIAFKASADDRVYTRSTTKTLALDRKTITDLGTFSISGTKWTDVTNPAIDGHEAVDLGLSVLWATCNVDADVPEGYGEYYQWGETEVETKAYNLSYYKYGNNQNNFSKYNYRDEITTLEAEDDVATQKWGERWRMPTNAEMQELLDNCNVSHKNTINGVKGTTFTSKINGKSIFFPWAGTKRSSNTNLTQGGTDGYYWTSTLVLSNLNHYDAYQLHINSSTLELNSRNAHRIYGNTIRPVTEK